MKEVTCTQKVTSFILYIKTNKWTGKSAETQDQTGDLQICSLTLPQLSYDYLSRSSTWRRLEGFG